MNPVDTDPYQLARDAAAAISGASGQDRHDIALVLGSGWGGAADLLGETVWSAPAEEIPGFHAPAVAGHVGTLRSILVEGTGTRVLVLGARTHYYEGRGVQAVVHGVRTAAAAGCRTIVLTNGCGGIDPAWGPGQPVLISDQINFTGDTPLTGATFVDLTDVYTPRLREIAREVDGSLPEGVYMQFRGPSYETPAEVRMARTIGASLVGMSTALEAIAAREAGMDVLGISLVTNLAAGISPEPLSHQEVLEAGQAAAPRISALLAEVVRRIGAQPDAGTGPAS
ncbi:purine-nucleoside phosphorylase [Brachybacterium hainanense]|uniref:Purine nucleoside phosphorylase n=1 Tax=Brachybacterium hainanense TaxID=1541174 RepID=A0ABV6RFC1_9MICO